MLTIGSFANVKYLLEKDVFNATGEKILSVCTVTKTYKKKKASYLCIVSSSIPTPNSKVLVYQIKQVDRDGEYKKKRIWSLQDIKLVDGKNETCKTHEFDMQCDKTFKWYAINLHERQNFLTVLYKQMIKQVGEKVEFKNIPASWKQEQTPCNLKSVDSDHKIHKTTDFIDEETEDYHILTEKEILELNNLLQKSEFAIKDAENFIIELSHTLYSLDGANIQSVLASEKKVFTLMQEIENAVQNAECFEKNLDSYDEILGHIRETMEKIGGKNAIIEIANNNNIKLMAKLNNIITQFNLPTTYQVCLSEPDLKTSSGRIMAIEAAKCLQKAMNGDVDPTLLRLAAIQEQLKRFEKLKAKFSFTTSRYLNNLFIHLGNDLGDLQSQQEELEISLSTHNSVHNELIAYSELMHWTKAMDKKSYDGLIKVYTKSLSKIYERDLKFFFTQARLKISSQIQQYREDLDISSSSKSKLSSTKQILVPFGTLGVNREMWGHCVENSEREKFDEILENVLSELEPVALQEQIFCVNFFQLDAKYNAEITAVHSENEMENLGLNENNINSTRKNVRQINEEVRNMMVSLFGVLETELLSFIQSLEKFDSFYSLYVLVRLTQHVMTAQDTQSFLSMTFASALVHGKRNLDRFMQQELQSIQDCKVQRKSKCGILPYVENFEDFAKTTEEIFRKSDRRTDMDKWYIIIVNNIFEAIPVHGNEFSKTPIQVVKMENYHHMYALLAQLKIPILEDSKKIAKLRYNDALKLYVTMYFGRPLEKLNLFFEGVQQKVSQGVKETEISYQMAFSKQELRKVISQYPVKEVKKGLENLYKKVEKHLCEEENLLQVVWHAMQEEFIAQYIFLEERIQKCYAGAMISLEFTIHDILTFFSDIARSH